MTFKSFLMLGLLALPVAVDAQQRGGGGRGFPPPQQQYDDWGNYQQSSLSIYSDNGERFLLILNGVKQNVIPQSRIRVESLPQYLNDVQIVFTDSRTPPLRKRVNLADPVNGRAVNLTLRMMRGRNGNAFLRFQKMTECERDYHGSRDEYVMYYGNPQQINTITETTYTDPFTGDVVTQTTTTTTDDVGFRNPPPPARGPMPMDNRTFNDVKQSINNASFEDTKVQTAKTILANNFVTTDQVMELCNLFSFENSKVDFAKFAYNRTVDPNNFYRVANIFTFDGSKRELNNFISSQGRR